MQRFVLFANIHEYSRRFHLFVFVLAINLTVQFVLALFSKFTIRKDLEKKDEKIKKENESLVKRITNK